ncbi:MAG: hypothetical protein P8Y67_14550 [Alphaproteobacteria bacterium]
MIRIAFVWLVVMIFAPYSQIVQGAPLWRIAANDGAASGDNKGAFSTNVVGEMRSYITGNAIIQDIAYLFGQGAVWGKDCITLHNGIINDILYKNQRIRLGDRIIGKGSTHERMFKKGKVSKLKSFAFLTESGRVATGNATAHSLKTSPGKYIEGNYRGVGVQIYGVSIHDGYHALTLTYGKNRSGSLEFHLIDNGPGTSLITGHRMFQTARELDRTLNEYIRGRAIRSYRVGRNKNQTMPARIDVYEIYAP